MARRLPIPSLPDQALGQLGAHVSNPRTWINKWRIGILTLAVFAALC